MQIRTQIQAKLTNKRFRRTETLPPAYGQLPAVEPMLII